MTLSALISANPGLAGATDGQTVLSITDYGAKGDTKFGSTLTSTNGSAVVTDSNGVWTSADVGKVFALSTGSSAGVDLITTIASVASATSITLAANCTTANHTVFSGTGYYAYGTDDTAAFNAAVASAASLFEQAGSNAVVGGSGKVAIQLESVAYMINGSQVTTNGTNAQIPLPVIASSGTTPIFELFFNGRGKGAVAPFPFQGNSPNTTGTVIFSTASNPAAWSTSAGVPSVFGGPATGKTGNAFSNLLAGFQDITFQGPGFPANTPMDLGWCSQAVVERVVVTNNNAGAFASIFTDCQEQYFGVIMPQVNAAGMSVLNDFVAWNCFAGVIPGETTCGRNWAVWACIVGIGIIDLSGSWSYNENAVCSYLDMAWCTFGIAGISMSGSTARSPINATANIDILDASIEEVASGGSNLVCSHSILDANNKLYGFMNFHHVKSFTQGGTPGLTSVTGGQNFRCQDYTVGSGNFASPPALPASTVALIPGTSTANLWRDVAITVSGGTVTAIAVDGVALGVTSGTVIVPSGRSITITYTVAPTWVWTVL